MNGRWANVWLVLLIASLGGCASMSSDECANSDWTAIGYEDGSRGYTSDRFTNRRKACAKHGITADFQTYQDGRHRGLVEFCRPSRGFTVGANGGQYNGVCAADLEPEFLEAYHVGYQLYNLRAKVNNASTRIYQHERELKNVKKDLRLMGVALISAETTTEERVLLLADIKDLSERSGQVEAKIQGLVAERARLQTELQHYEATVAAYGY